MNRIVRFICIVGSGVINSKWAGVIFLALSGVLMGLVAKDQILASRPYSEIHRSQLDGSSENIVIGDLLISAAEGRMMLHNAIKEEDFTRVKYLVDSGVPLTSKFDKGCNIELVEYLVAVGASTDARCAENALLAAASKLDREINPEEFGYFNPALREGDKVREAQYDDLKAKENKREDIYRFLLSKTRNEDYYQLPGVFTKTNVPLAIRKDALEIYLAHPEVASSEFWPLHFKVISDNFIDYAVAYNSRLESIRSNSEGNMASRKKPLDLPELSVSSLTNGRVSYEESTNSVFHYHGYGRVYGFLNRPDFEDIYKLNSEIAIIAMIFENGKVKLNSKDQSGAAMLHLIIDRYNSNFADDKRARPIAVLVRYLINKGADSGFKKKGEDSAEMVVQRKYLASGGGWTELLRAFKDPSYN